MKKLLLVIPIVVLLAAGCNSSQQTNNQIPTQTPAIQNTPATTNPTPVPTPTPTPSTTPTSESYLQSLVSKVTNWNAYQPLTNGNQYVGSDPCDGETGAQINSENAYMDKVNSDVNVKNLVIDNSPDAYYGGELAAYITPNYQNWTAQQFIAYKGACSAGSPATLFAYPDKVVWLSTCGGGVAPDDNNPNKQAILNAENKCQSDAELLLKYFQGLAQNGSK